jgi:hypothetical protein
MLRKVILKYVPLLFVILMVFLPGQIELKALEKGGLYYVTVPGSRIWLEGTSTVNDYVCATGKVEGFAEISSYFNIHSGTLRKDKVLVSIAVRTLDCGNNSMNKDMYKAMKADEFPEIKYELVYTRISAKPDSSKFLTLNSLGYISIAGLRKLENIKITIEKLPDGYFRLIGCLPVSMLDFGITPPEHLLGLIKAHDKLIVHFDLIVSEEKASRKILESKNNLQN